MELLSSISSILPHYRAFFLDLWGVIHDGSQLYPHVRETLLEIKKNGGRVVFISNAPRRASRVASVLNDLGIDNSLYDHIVSSGEVGYHWLESGISPWGTRYYLISAQKDRDLIEHLDFTEVLDLKDADFILNLGFGSEEQTINDYSLLLNRAAELSINMLCLNPDLEVIKMSGERYPCAGAIAKEYEKLGGNVQWFGKPHAMVYEYAHKLIDNINKKDILAVGDSLETDIPGAENFGVDSILVTDGILKDKDISDIQEICVKLSLRPNYLVPKFGILP